MLHIDLFDARAAITVLHDTLYVVAVNATKEPPASNASTFASNARRRLHLSSPASSMPARHHGEASQSARRMQVGDARVAREGDVLKFVPWNGHVEARSCVGAHAYGSQFGGALDKSLQTTIQLDASPDIYLLCASRLKVLLPTP